MNLVEISLAFVEGLALIASPCILPVLPLVLSTSIDGGHRRPFGIILGFIAAFSSFALLSRQLVGIFHLNLDYIKYGSLVILALFGIVMLSEKLSQIFSQLTQGLASRATELSSNQQGGFISGLMIGCLIGIIWTPCAGPILAVAFVEIIRQKNSLSAAILIISFALGAGLPMLIISLTGRSIMSRLKFLTTHATLVRKILGILILFSVVFIASGANATNLFINHSDQSVDKSAVNNMLENGLDSPYQAPEIAKSNIWLNTPNNQPLTLASLKGKVVLIDFWTYSCINCIRTIPYIKKWYKQYQNKGFVVIGIQAPEFEFEKNVDNVRMAIQKFGITYPVALDNNLDTWTNYNNQYWPAHYLIDRNGKVVYTHFGEGDYQTTENNIRILLGLNQANIPSDSMQFNQNQTPETYLGYERAEAFDSPGNAIPDNSNNYNLPDFLPTDNWALSGKWLISAKRITSTGNNTKLQLNFTAQHVYLVLGPNDNGMANTAIVKLNGKKVGVGTAGIDDPEGLITIKQYRLYELINQGTSKNGLLEIDIQNPGFNAYAFTFG